MKAIVGYTGFVGRNIVSKAKFEGLYNSKNILEAFGTKPDLLIYSGVPAEMFTSNKNPKIDRERIKTAINNIQKIEPKSIVLISTIAVYDKTLEIDEEYEINADKLTPYGANRLHLEKWVQNNIGDSYIIRLPAIYGEGLKKNFIFDYINRIPAILDQSKYSELSGKSELIKCSYQQMSDGFYHIVNLEQSDRKYLYEDFMRLGFSALNFTDSRSIYQFYWLEHLWEHINISISRKIRLLNICTEPIEVRKLYRKIEGREFINELNSPPFNYNIKTKYANIFGGANGYIQSKEIVIKELSRFISKERIIKWG